MRARRFDLLVFDWDGTIVDSAGHIAASIRAACVDLELPIPTDAAARHVIGLGMRDAMAYLLPELEQSRHREVADRYRHHFLAGDEAIETFPEVDDGIPQLEALGFTLTVATGKSRVGLDRALRKVPFGGCFFATRCVDEGFPKPHPDMLLHLMQVTGVDPSRTLMIGDTSHDLELAANAGASSIAVSYGAHSLEALQQYGPLGCVGSFAELLEWLQANA
jgi:phosphoglycolate phosphatase